MPIDSNCITRGSGQHPALAIIVFHERLSDPLLPQQPDSDDLGKAQIAKQGQHQDGPVHRWQGWNSEGHDGSRRGGSCFLYPLSV